MPNLHSNYFAILPHSSSVPVFGWFSPEIIPTLEYWVQFIFYRFYFLVQSSDSYEKSVSIFPIVQFTNHFYSFSVYFMHSFKHFHLYARKWWMNLNIMAQMWFEILFNLFSKSVSFYSPEFFQTNYKLFLPVDLFRFFLIIFYSFFRYFLLAWARFPWKYNRKYL